MFCMNVEINIFNHNKSPQPKGLLSCGRSFSCKKIPCRNDYWVMEESQLLKKSSAGRTLGLRKEPQLSIKVLSRKDSWVMEGV
jgi:hypothetical protein